MHARERLERLLVHRLPAGLRAVRRLRRLLRGPSPEHERARALYAPLVAPGSLCFDVGANHGIRSEIFLALGARVVAIEPQPECLRYLSARLGRHPRLTVVPQAVGAAPGLATLFVGGSDRISTLSRGFMSDAQRIPELAAIGWQGEITVPVTTLDELIAAHGVPDHCKIDVEGFEAEVLRGLRWALSSLSVEITWWRQGPVFDCLTELARLGDYRFNLTRLEAMEMQLPEWVDRAGIEEVLRRDYQRTEFGYGDLFARRVT